VLEVDPMRYQTELRPRMPSTRTSAASRRADDGGVAAFQRSRPSSASGLVFARAISISGIVHLPSAGALRRLLRRTQGGAPVEQPVERSGRRLDPLPRVAVRGEPLQHHGQHVPLRVAVRHLRPGQRGGTRASAVGRTEYAEATVRSLAFWLKSTKTPCRSSFHQRLVARSARAVLDLARDGLGRQPEVAERQRGSIRV
jgi:hypothetical protein